MAAYEQTSSTLEEKFNGKDGHNHHPELILHFYKNEKRIKESVQFTHENLEIISDINFAEYIGEIKEYLIYECSVEKHRFQPDNDQMIELRKCLIDKIATDQK